MNEKMLMYAWGCPIYENTIERLAFMAAFTVDPKVKELFETLRENLKAVFEDDPNGYEKYFHAVRLEMQGLFLSMETVERLEAIGKENEPMTKLTKYEQETIIQENRAEKEAVIFTYDPRLKRRLKAFAKQYPEVCRLDSLNFYGGETYVVNKDRLSFRLLAPLKEHKQLNSSWRLKSISR